MSTSFQPNHGFSWNRFLAIVWARMKLLAWMLIVAPPLVLLYAVMISEGIRIKFPFWAIPIYKIKGMPQLLERYEIFHRMDLAIPASIGLLFFVAIFWSWLLQIYLSPEGFHARSRQRPELYKRIVVALGVALILFDAWLFYVSMTFMGWGGQFSATALLSTVGYVAVLIAVSLITNNLRLNIEEIKQEHN